MRPLRPAGRGPAGGRSLAVVLVVALFASVGPAVPAGAATVVASADDVADSDRPSEGAAGSQAPVGLDVAPVIDLLGQFDDGEDEEDEEDETEEDEDDEEGEGDEGEEEREGDDDEGDEDEVDDDRDGEEGEDTDREAGSLFGDGPTERGGRPFGEGPPDDASPPGGGDSSDGSGVDDFVQTLVTEVVGGPDGDRPGHDGDGPPDDWRGNDDEADEDEPGGNGVDDGAGGAAGGEVADEPDSNSGESGDDEERGPPPPAGGGPDGGSSSQVEEPTTTEPPEPARLRVADVTTNRSVVAGGEPVRITATVVNDGEEPGSRDVRLRLFGEVVDARTVTVPGGGAREVSFERTILAPGTYEASVGDASATVTVEASGTTTATDVDPASQELPGFTALVALLGVLATALWARLRTE